MSEKPVTRRCAVYARKSTDEGLEMEFNSLDAQRESCEAYIASQKANGWICLPDHYDDGGFSGGNTNRPALKQLLLDCEAGKVDIIVCYKVDRLSRSLCDFTELSKQFAKWGVAFVSVTQQIDTSTSGGKMMLNMLMTFAEYEREIIGERIRDKMRATRKKGLWAGGCVAIGYNLVDHHLIPNPDEVPIVQRIFRRYVETQSPKQVAAELNRDGVMTRKGIPWNNTKIYAVLNNYAYIGQINYKGEISQGIHPAIIDIETWDKAHEFLDANSPTKGGRKERREEAHPLKCLLKCGHCGGPLSPYRRRKNGRIYVYYRCLRDTKRAISSCPIKEVAGPVIEKLVFDKLSAIFRSPEVTRQIAMHCDQETMDILEMMDGDFWAEASTAERYRLVELLVGGATLYTDHLTMEIKTEGIKSIMEEIENESSQN